MLYRKLKEENNKLKAEIAYLKSDKTYDIMKIEERYKKEYEKRLEFEKVRYNTKIKRKKQIETLCNSLEQKINNSVTSFMDIDIKSDVESLMLLLEYLKEE